jgi:hypothetical protein
LTKYARRDHIFISYAWEDAKFAHWLAKVLAREGYSVWIDQLKLLGGEPFPGEITEAITEGTHRLLAVMSHNSLKKASPSRERTLADKAGRKLGLNDFLIPLSIDDLSPNDFDFVTTELTSLPFQKSWDEGLKLLIKKLDSTGAHKDVEAGRRRLMEWYSTQLNCVGPAESVVSNLVEFAEVPRMLHCYIFAKTIDVQAVARRWVCWSTRSGKHWSFSPPSDLSGRQYKRLHSVDWMNTPTADDIIPRNVVVTLLYRYLLGSLKRRGLSENVETNRLRFREGLFEKDKIRYVNLNGRKTSVMIKSERTSGYKNNEPVKFLSHLEPDLRIVLDRFSRPHLGISMRIAVSDLNGRPLKPKTGLSRRKKATRGWNNSHWLGRNLAFLSWLTHAKPITLLKTESGNLKLECKFKEIKIDRGIDESKIPEMKVKDPFDEVDE